MKKIFSKEIIFKISLSFMLLYFTIILFGCFNDNVQELYLNNNKLYYYLVAFFISLVTLIVFILLKRIIDRLNKKKLKIFNIISILVIFIIQIILLNIFNVEQITDPCYVNERAASIVNDDYNLNISSNYFEIYDNNNMVLFTTVKVLKLAKLLHISNYSKFLIFFNILMIDISIILLYMVAKKIKGDKFASLTLGLSVLNPINYLFIFWTYTVTYSLPFFAALIYVYLLIKELKYEDNKVRITLYSILFGLIGAFGYLMRPTLIIPITAMIIILLYDLLNKRIVFKERIIPLVFIIISLVLSFKIFDNCTRKYVGKQENTLPISHWIMMGLHGEGTTSTKDLNYSLSFKTRDKIRKANNDEIVKTLKEYKVKGFIKHLIVKIPKTWSDGTSAYYLRTRNDRKINSLFLYITGDKKDLLCIYARAFRFILYLCIIVYLIKELLKKKYDEIDLNILILLGAFVFYLIWEAKSAYCIPFMLVLTILGSKGLYIVDDKVSKLNNKKINICFISISIVSILTLGFGYKYLVKNKLPIKDFSVYTYNNALNDTINDVYKNDTVITQEFIARNKINRIGIMANVINENDTKYIISLMDNNKELYSKEIDYRYVKKDFITVKLPKSIKIKKGNKYKIVIKKGSKEKDKTDSIEWIYLKTYKSDTYEGNMYINDNKTNNDLYTRIYYLHNTNYINKKIYIIISGIILSSEIVLYWLYLKNKKNRS